MTDARARTGELGAEWPKAATKIYTAEQAALTGRPTRPRRCSRPRMAELSPCRAPRRPAAGQPSPPGRRRRSSRRTARRRPARSERLLQLAFLLPAVAFLLLFFGYPVVKNVVMGFQHYTTRHVLHRRRAVGRL